MGPARVSPLRPSSAAGSWPNRGAAPPYPHRIPLALRTRSVPWRKDRTSCCRHGSGPRGRAPGGASCGEKRTQLQPREWQGPPVLQVSTDPSGGRGPRALRPRLLSPGRVPSQRPSRTPTRGPRVAQIPAADREGQPHPSPGS